MVGMKKPFCCMLGVHKYGWLDRAMFYSSLKCHKCNSPHPKWDDEDLNLEREYWHTHSYNTTRDTFWNLSEMIKWVEEQKDAKD